MRNRTGTRMVGRIHITAAFDHNSSLDHGRNQREVVRCNEYRRIRTVFFIMTRQGRYSFRS